MLCTRRRGRGDEAGYSVEDDVVNATSANAMKMRYTTIAELGTACYPGADIPSLVWSGSQDALGQQWVYELT